MATSVVEVKVTDLEQVRALAAGTAAALDRFAALGDEDRAALPAAAREGIEALTACGGASRPPRDLEWQGVVILEWPPPGSYQRPMAGWDTSVLDAATGQPITTVTDACVRVDADHFVTADLTMLADEDGRPVLAGEPRFRDGEVITGVFRFAVSEMRVRAE